MTNEANALGLPWGSTVHHVGRIVPDIGATMSLLSAHYGLRWEPMRRYDLHVRDRGVEKNVPMQVCTSLDAPMQIELFQEAPGSPWTRDRGQPVHHICYWVEDRAAEAARLIALGWELEVTGVGPELVNTFCYLIGPDGMRVEPKSVDGAEGARPWPVEAAATT